MYEIDLSLKIDGKPISRLTCKSLKEAREFLDKIEKAAQLMCYNLKKVV